MTIGASIFCLVVGAILTFAIETDSTEGVNIDTVGIILMIAGVVGLLFYALIWGPRTRRIARPVQVVEAQPVVQSTPVVERIIER